MKRSPTLRIASLLLAVAASTVALPTTTRAGTTPTPPTTTPDVTYNPPVFLIHVTGHGTTSGDVVDDFIAIYNAEPDGEGHFLTADGFGGTIGWGSDFHSGPYGTATAVCDAAAGKFVQGSPVVGGMGPYDSIDCSIYDPSLTVPPSTDPPDTTSPDQSTPDTSTPDTDPAPTCSIKGVVIDALGEPVPDIHIHVSAGGLSLDTASLDDGSYSFAEIGDDPGSGIFDSRTDDVQISLISEEYFHTPQRFVVYYRQQGDRLSTPPFRIPDDGNCDYDFDMRALPNNYVSRVAPLEDWPAVVHIYLGIHQAWGLADYLSFSPAYGLPLQVRSFCDNPAKCNGGHTAFFGSSRSQSQVVDRPYISIPPDDSRLTSPNRDDNREFHEFGHFIEASMFGGNSDTIRPDDNHAGYGNSSSADSWSEGWAEFWSTMVSKYIAGRADPSMYHWEGGISDLLQPFDAWDDEEFAMASVLVQLEALSIDPTPAQARPKRTFSLDGYTEVNDPTYGRLIVGHVLNLTSGSRPGEGTSFGTIAGATFYDANRKAIDASYAATIPANLAGNGGRGLFVLAVPKGLSYKDLSINVFEGRPKPGRPAAEGFDVSLPQIFAAVRNYSSSKPLAAGHVFDVEDLYRALKMAFGGLGPTSDGLDLIDALFIDNGFFDDSNGDRAYVAGDEIGASSHPAYGDPARCVPVITPGCSPNRLPRGGYIGIPGNLMSVDTSDGDGNPVIADVFAQVLYPEDQRESSYGYLVVPDEDGHVTVAVPPAGSGATVILIALADGYTPTVLGEVDAATFWKDAATQAGSFLSFDAQLDKGDFELPQNPLTIAYGDNAPGSRSSAHKAQGVGVLSVVILIGGIAVSVLIGLGLSRRRRTA